MSKVRLFVGSLLDQPEAERLRIFAEENGAGIKQLMLPSTGRFIAPAKLHMTWLFLGDTEAANLPAIETWLKAEMQSLPALDIDVVYTKLEAWPKAGAARVIVASPDVVAEPLARLGAALNSNFQKFCREAGAGLFPASASVERFAQYKPHLTLMRANPPVGLGAEACEHKAMRMLSTALPIKHHLNEMFLIQSHTGQGEQDYEKLLKLL